VKYLLTSPKFIAITLGILALVILPLILIEAQQHQIFEQNAAVIEFGSSSNSSCPGYNGDTNAVIWCGADANGTAKASEITTRYNKGDGHNSAKSIQNIYGSNYFHISSSDIQNLSKNAKIGSVTKSGDVLLNGKVIAKNAVTAGRSNITGSTKRTSNGTVFYSRPPQVSFKDNSLSAYIVLVNGQFKYAILLSCGNPVIGTPITQPKPTPTPTPKPKPTPTLRPGITPTSTPRPTPTKAPTPTPTLPPGVPTPTICPTVKPVTNVHITCPNCNVNQNSGQ